MLIIAIIEGPLAFITISIAQQASDAYILIASKINQLSTIETQVLQQLELYPEIESTARNFIENNPISLSNILESIGNAVSLVSSYALSYTTNIIKQLTIFILHAIIFCFTVFYLLRDGHKLLGYMRSVLPLTEKHCTNLFGKIKDLMHSIMYGIIGASIIQGALLGVGFAIVGIPNAVFWGTITAFFSPIPYVGTVVIWLPAVIAYYLTGQYIAATFLLTWCAGIVGTADNIVKPYLIGNSTSLNPLMVMLVMLGGTFAFGFQGLVFGPTILMLLLAFLDIYKEEFIPKKSTQKKRAIKKKA